MVKKVNRLAMSRHYPMTIRPLHISVTVTTLSSLEPIVILLLLLPLLFTTFRAKSLLHIGPSLHLGPKRITLRTFITFRVICYIWGLTWSTTRTATEGWWYFPQWPILSCCRQSVTVSFDIVIKVPKTCTKKLLLKKFLIIFSINGRVFVLRFALRTLCHCSKIHAPHLF